MSELQKTEDDQLVSPGRRAFFRRFAPEPEQIVPDSCYPRPPWAVDNTLFLALCTQCDQCIDQCPMRVLGRSDEKEEILAGRPVMDLSYGSCDFCGRCVDACPSGALDREKGKVRQAIPQLAGSCQAELGLYCNLCEEACPDKAIQFGADKKPVIDLIPIAFSNYCITAHWREHKLNRRPASPHRLFQASQQQSTISS